MNEELGTFGTAVAILSGANPIIAGAVGIVAGILSGWFGRGKKTKKETAKAKEEIKQILRDQLEKDAARKGYNVSPVDPEHGV